MDLFSDGLSALMDLVTDGFSALTEFVTRGAFIEHARRLDKKEFETSSKIAQVFSATLFSALTGYLVFSNSTRMSYIHRASIEKRLSYCCYINTIVAGLSAACNLFQLTEVDNWELKRQSQYSVDTSRPIEWILTCPLMQLSLVIMGGPKIPDYRRTLMPFLAGLALVFASATLFLEKNYIIATCYSCGALTHSTAMFFNRKQIIEHSRGVEGVFSGDSEYRRASLILMGTWFPFPVWMMLSPEGFNVITSVTIIQMGWACLNITAKFTLTFYIQRIKDNYTNRLKVQRALGDQTGGNYMEAITDQDVDGGNMSPRRIESKFRACVTETMAFLGMQENTERFVKLLQQANIATLDEVAMLTQEDCTRLKVPFDLIHVLQTRQRVWALELVDEAEVGLEQGERFYSIGPEYKGDSPRIVKSMLENDSPMGVNTMQGNVMSGSMSPEKVIPSNIIRTSVTPMPQSPHMVHPMDYGGPMDVHKTVHQMPNGVPAGFMNQPPMYSNMQTSPPSKSSPMEQSKQDRATSMTMLPRENLRENNYQHRESQSPYRERPHETSVVAYDRGGDAFDRNGRDVYDRSERPSSGRHDVFERNDRLVRQMSRNMELQRDMTRDLTRDITRDVTDVSQRMAREVAVDVSRHHADMQNSILMEMTQRQQSDNTLIMDTIGKMLSELEANVLNRLSEKTDHVHQSFQDIAKSQEKFQSSMEKSHAVLETKLQYGVPAPVPILSPYPAQILPYLDQDRREHERREHERQDQERREQERRDQERRDEERRDEERRDQERREIERREREHTQELDRRAYREELFNSQSILSNLQMHFEQCLAQAVEKIVQTSSSIEDSNAASFRSMENMLIDVFEKLDVVKASQQTLMSNLGGGSIQDMTESLTKNIIHQVAQENKATAFTLQARMTLIDETQNKKQGEIEERLGQRIQQMILESTHGLQELVTHQTQVSTEQVCGAIEAWKTDSSGETARIDQKLSDLATYMNQESSKQLESGLAVFGNSLRVQLDTMHSAQINMHRDSESNVTTKLQSLFGEVYQRIDSTDKIEVVEALIRDGMQQLSQEHSNKIAALASSLREFMRHQGGGRGNDEGIGFRDNHNEWPLNRLPAAEHAVQLSPSLQHVVLQQAQYRPTTPRQPSGRVSGGGSSGTGSGVRHANDGGARSQYTS